MGDESVDTEAGLIARLPTVEEVVADARANPEPDHFLVLTEKGLVGVWSRGA